jgi:hypothetical protein
VKQEPTSAPPRRSSGALVIREGARTSSPPLRGRKLALREAIAESLADNSMPMDAVLA